MKTVTKILVWISNSDYSLFQMVSGKSRLSIQAAGITILLTAVLAAISGGFAIYTAFESLIIAIAAGLLWGSLILIIDREIYGTRSKTAALLRLPFAIIIGAIVATPLEIQLFSGRIGEKISQMEVLENEEKFMEVKDAHNDIRGRFRAIDQEIKQLKQEISKYNALMEAEVVGRVQNGTTGVAGYGPAYDAARDAKEESLRLLDMAVTSRKSLEQSADKEISVAEKIFEKEKVTKSYDFLAKYEALNELKNESDSIYWICLFVFMLFVLIEVMPALLKLFQDKDDYSVLVRAQQSFNEQRINLVHNSLIQEIAYDPMNAPKKTFLSEVDRLPLAG